MGNSRPLPDPRFRAPIGLNELQNIVNLLVAKNSLSARVVVIEDTTGSVPVASVTGVSLSGRITVNPRAAREIPPNSWAFILAHEIAHLTDERAQESPRRDIVTAEWNADEIGAGYALRGGFDLAAHLGWIFSRPDQWSPRHGGQYDRARRLATRYGVNWSAVRSCQERYRLSLARGAR